MHSVTGAFLLTIFVALTPKGACGSAGWVSNTIRYHSLKPHKSPIINNQFSNSIYFVLVMFVT